MSEEKQFGVHSDMKKLYLAYLGIGTLGGFLSWIIPVTVAAALSLPLNIALEVALSLLLPLLLGFGFIAFWIPKYYASISYALTDEEIIVQRGVWWKKKNFVPYNRITNVNISQGPIARYFGLGKVSIQTAGYSGAGGTAGGMLAEANIFGIKNFEEIKDTVMDYVRGLKPVAVEAEAVAPRDVSRKMLAELERIRKALEK